MWHVCLQQSPCCEAGSPNGEEVKVTGALARTFRQPSLEGEWKLVAEAIRAVDDLTMTTDGSAAASEGPLKSWYLGAYPVSAEETSRWYHLLHRACVKRSKHDRE